MVRTYRADLHIHSCLSPCSELDMTPRKIVEKAAEIGLDIIGLADHNSAEHIEVTQKIAHDFDLTVLPAMEITTSEEVHILALFGSIQDCMEVQKEVYTSLSAIPSYRHDETSQPVVNEREEILFFNQLPLINAADIPLASLIDLIHARRGLAVASHIDRETFGIISQLGFIPEGLPLDAVEVSYRIKSLEEALNFLSGQHYPLVSFSDSHHLADLGRRITEFHLQNPTMEEISLALQGKENRSVSIVF